VSCSKASAGLAEFVIEQLGHVRFIVDDEDALEVFGVHKGEPYTKASAGWPPALGYD